MIVNFTESFTLQYLYMQDEQYLLEIDEDEEQQLSPLLQENLMSIADAMTKISIFSTERVQEYWKVIAEDIQHNTLILKDSSDNALFSFRAWEYPIQKPTVSPICSKSIADSPNKKAFRCFDCISINTALLCYDCFSKSNHKGHSYRQFQSMGGCCDCGDSQLWNQNGFCPDHNSKSVIPNLQVSLVETFKKQLLFLFNFYFLLALKQSQFNELRQTLGKKLFTYLIDISNKDYESKVLVGQLLNSKFQDFYDESIKGRLITMIFNLNPNFHELEDLKSISFSMYPVESFRSVLLRQYFDLTAKNQFLCEHPLKKFNFQYLICVRAIVKMVKQKQLKPIHLSKSVPLKDREHTQSIFKKYFEDVSYLRKTKESQEYFQMHFNILNINQMFFYRQLTSIDGGYHLDLDQFALKLVGVSLEYFRDNRLLLKKGMGQLFIEIQNNQKISYCMPHERAFALYLMSYLQGNLSSLQDLTISGQITNILGFNEQNKSGYIDIFRKIIKKGLMNLAYLLSDKPIQRNDYQRYFFLVYPEKNFEFSLDLIYHKSLYLLSYSIIDYASIVEEVFQQLRKKQNCQILVAALSIFMARMFSDTLNEACIANFLGYTDVEYTKMFDLRMIATYCNKMSIKQLKSLSNYFINNPQIFDQILHQYVRLQKGKIKLAQEAKPLQRLLYNDYFTHFKYNSQIICSKTDYLQFIPYLQKDSPFTPSLINFLISNFMRTYQQYQEPNNSKKQTYLKILQYEINGLLLVYLLTKSQQIMEFFNHFGYKISKNFKNNHFRQQIGNLLVQKHTAEKSKEQMIDQQEQLKRKEKIALKRKEKQAILKIKQQAALKQFLPSAEDSENAQQCVYCKQALDKEYRLMGFVNLTDFVAKQYKSSQIHFFMTTCNHKMHEHCYNKYLGEKKSIQVCFLCKKKTNFAIHKRQISIQNAEVAALTFFDDIYISLLNVYGQNDSIFNDYYTSQCNESILQLVIMGLSKELIYFGLHQFSTFRKYALQGYFVLYQMLVHANKQQLKEAFKNIQSYNLKNTNKQNLIFQLQGYCYKLLQQKFLGEKIEQAEVQLQYANKLKALIQIIQNKSMEEMQIQPINLITMDKTFIKIPNNIHDLHEMMGQCPFCKKITNWLYYCLLCGWKCCNKQIDHFLKHSLDHYEGSLFISAGNGKTSIISLERVSNQESIYENEFGQEYCHIEDNLKKQTLLSYKLNEAKLQNLFNKLLTHSLQNV